MQTYSDFFKTLHDEQEPTGYLGRGTHYSVLRAVVFRDPMGKPLSEGQFADFAVIWDEDHDVRVIEPIEEVYRRGLLSSFIMFGECKGSFTAILSGRFSSAAKASPFRPAFFKAIDNLELSVRSQNCLKNDGIFYIGDLVQKNEAEMLRSSNFGRKSLNEIKEVLALLGLHLGMEVRGWPPGNLELVKEYYDENPFANYEAARLVSVETKVKAICQSLSDPWASKVVALGSASNPIIDDEDEKVSLYLKNLEMLWQLGIVTQNAVAEDKLSTMAERMALKRNKQQKLELAQGWTTDPQEADSDIL